MSPIRTALGVAALAAAAAAGVQQQQHSTSSSSSSVPVLDLSNPALAREVLRSTTAAGINTLLTYFDPKTGWIGNMSGGVPFWTTANAVETMANYMILEPASMPLLLPYIEAIFAAAIPRYCTPKSCW